MSMGPALIGEDGLLVARRAPWRLFGAPLGPAVSSSICSVTGSGSLCRPSVGGAIISFSISGRFFDSGMELEECSWFVAGD
jgi:hypothetical protein